METGYRRILLATAMDEDGNAVLQQAIDLARKYGAGLTVMHALEPLSDFGQSLVNTYLLPETGGQLHQQNVQHVKEEMLKRLQIFCGQEEVGPIDDVRVVEERPETAILNTADAIGADLIVMGTHRHSRATEAILGTTTFRVLHSATLPVLVVPIGT